MSEAWGLGDKADTTIMMELLDGSSVPGRVLGGLTR